MTILQSRQPRKNGPTAEQPVDLLNPDQALEFAQHHLADMPKRLRHVIVIADQVRETAARLNHKHPELDIDLELAYCAGLLHDIGYAEIAKKTGYHPIDGRDFLSARGFSELGELILGHGCGPEAAALQGISGVVMSDDIIAKLVTYWDVRVLQGGRIVTYAERLKDIEKRYGPDSGAVRAHQAAGSRIKMLIAEIDQLLNS